MISPSQTYIPIITLNLLPPSVSNCFVDLNVSCLCRGHRLCPGDPESLPGDGEHILGRPHLNGPDPSVPEQLQAGQPVTGGRAQLQL